jgi:predicted ATPase/class 3 adenylate cyclase
LAVDVHIEPPAGAAAPLNDGVLTFLFTDIEGSVRKWEAAPAAMREALRRHDDIFRREISARGGHIFRTVGDAFHAAFALPSIATDAAIACLTALAREDFSEVKGLNVRVAIHAGPVESRDGDYFGQGINRTARLLSLAHGGQALLSGTVARMIEGELPPGATLLDLGSHFLRDRADAERIFQIQTRELQSVFPPLRSPGKPPNNLPRGATSFVGREREMLEVEAVLDRARLLTLIGNGGAGKTRLAIEAAVRLAPRFPDGLWFVDFSGVDEPLVVPEKVATVVGARSTPNQSGTASLVSALYDKTALLIFDNCEHLLGATSDLAHQILQACPGVSVLATSRQALALGAEHLLRLSNLEPPQEANLTAASALRYPAVQLFVDRAGATSRFELDDENAAWVADICRRLDGIPLAIELAAPQLRLERPERLAELLRESFELHSPFRTTPDRHHTLTTTLDWSYRLLREDERLLFERLGVFASGCTMATAISVCGGEGVPAERVPSLVAELVDKSLVVADLGGPVSRFRLLETTRSYIAERARQRGDNNATRKRFALALAAILAESYEAWPRSRTEAWIEKYAPELDNVRACLDWAYGPGGDPRIVAELTSFSLRLWDELGLLPERQRWFERAVSVAPPDLAPEMLARIYLGRTSLSAAADPSRFGMADRAIALLREGPVGIDLGDALAKAGAALLTPSTVDAARPYLAEALAILTKLGPTKQLGACLRSLCAVQFFQADFPGARQYGLESESVCRKIGDTYGLISNRINLAEVDFASGDVAHAISTAQRVLKEGKGTATLLAVCQANLTSYLLSADQIDAARPVAAEALSRARALAWPEAVARALEHLALIGLLDGYADDAAQLLGFVEHCSDDWAKTQQPIEKILHDRLVGEIGRRVPPDRLDTLLRVGASWSEDEASEVAIRLAR